jgi:hypothetical protein
VIPAGILYRHLFRHSAGIAATVTPSTRWLALFAAVSHLVMSGAPPEGQFQLKMVDMSDELVADLKDIVKEAFQEESNERERAARIKKQFDEKQGRFGTASLASRSAPSALTKPSISFIFTTDRPQSNYGNAVEMPLTPLQ